LLKTALAGCGYELDRKQRNSSAGNSANFSRGIPTLSQRRFTSTDGQLLLDSIDVYALCLADFFRAV